MNYSAPTYLTELVTTVSQETLSEIHQNYGDNTTAFKFKVKFNSIIRTWLEEWQQYGGSIWALDTAGKKILLFDQFRHGYNAMMKLNEEEDFNSSKSVDLTEPTEIIIAFQYSGDEDQYLEDGSSKFKQDYFGWVIIYKKLDTNLEEVLSYECG